jgi:hypothetical protein
MQMIKHLILVILLFCFSEIRAFPLTTPTEPQSNSTPFTITLLGCGIFPEPASYLVGTEVEEGVINVYFAQEFDDFGGVVPCVGTDMVAEVGPFPSGTYTLNAYTIYINVPSGETFLQDSQVITVEQESNNEPPLGGIEFSGEAVEDQIVTVSHSLTDANGMGEVDYQWFRNGEAIFGATSEAYRLTDDDVWQTLTVTASYLDGLGKAEQVTSMPLRAPGGIENLDDETVGSVAIRGSVSEGGSLVIDTSGLYDADGIAGYSYQWKRRYRPYSTIDETIGQNSASYEPSPNDTFRFITAIVSYRDNYGGRGEVEANLTGAVSPASGPVVTPPADLSVPATGTFTEVEPGSATAQDDDEGELAVELSSLVSNGVEMPLPDEGQISLRPGTHLLTWSAADSKGVTGEGLQIVRVDPMISFGEDLSLSPESSLGCPLVLNGSVARYPVSVPFTLFGVRQTDLSEQLLYEGSYHIKSPQQELMLSLLSGWVGDTSNYQSLKIVMDQPTHAVLGDKPSCRMVISDENLPPEVSLIAYQGGTALRIVSRQGGAVSVLSTVVDLNVNDTLTYDWSDTDVDLSDTDSQEETLTFDPADLQPGLYRVVLRVSDGVTNSVAGLSIRVVSAHPDLSGIDSDGDGDTDQVEGVGDADGDGIPDYLDPAGLGVNLLPQDIGSSTEYILETEPGLKLSVGEVALYNLKPGSLISREEMLAYVDSEGGEADSADYPYEGGLFDFTIGGLAQAGSSVRVVIPQRQAIAAESVYRKQTQSGWREFIADENNLIKSASGEAGRCPSPGDAAYVSGLVEGSWCVELTIEDGGANDRDDEANGRISDPGGVTTLLSNEEDDVAGDGNNDDGGGGALTFWLFIMMLVLLQHNIYGCRERRGLR